MPDWLLIIAPYLVGSASAGLALFLLLDMKRQQQEFEKRWVKRQMLMQSELGKLRGNVQDLQARLSEAEHRAELDSTPSGMMSGLNLNRRAQALRLFRRGEKPEQVAAAVGVASNEAELLLKIHRLTIR